MTISAKVIADSISEKGVRITTFELEYPRFIHAEFMTHRLFSRNAASSRAIPVKRAIELIKENTAMPIHWGKNQPGMSAKEECDAKIPRLDFSFNDDNKEITKKVIEITREELWKESRDMAISMAEMFDKAGYHKQIVNRLLEPFTHIKVVCTATEYDNFFYLRRHPDAQPEIQELANQMWLAREASTPKKLTGRDWHVPYFDDGTWRHDTGMTSDIYPSLNDALAISASCCAQVSYRRNDDSIEKAKEIFRKLVEMKPVHASPFEHQATPMSGSQNEISKEKGVTHLDQKGDFWSGNLRGWIQHRHLIEDNTCWEYKE